MKAVTGNLLSNGRVVYLAADDHWTERLEDAMLLDDADAEPVLAAAKSRIREIANAYLIDAENGAATGQKALRETIRASGPSVRKDLGKQAEPRS
ncbi:MAG: DUF2849 domain-containing protein [Alphaproteobacteria bacterium]|nr:DUF2849 domain-containing protein [Alphaproteobacteria bacterium]